MPPNPIAPRILDQPGARLNCFVGKIWAQPGIGQIPFKLVWWGETPGEFTIGNLRFTNPPTFHARRVNRK
jgi:hypothetical protein